MGKKGKTGAVGKEKEKLEKDSDGPSPSPEKSPPPATGSTTSTTSEGGKHQQAEAEDPHKDGKIKKLSLLLSSKESALSNCEAALKDLQSDLGKRTSDTVDKSGIGRTKDGESTARLELMIQEGKDLPKMDWYSGKCDPYVEILVSPADCSPNPPSTLRTKVIPNSRNPIFNASFSFPSLTSLPSTVTFNLMDAESFGNDDFVGCVTVQLQKMGESGNKWYPIADPEKKTQAKQLSGSLLLGCELVKSEKGRLEEEIKGREKEKDKLKKDIAKIHLHIDRLSGKAVPTGTASDDIWLFAEFDKDTPLLFTDCQPVKTGDVVDGKVVGKDDICTIM